MQMPCPKCRATGLLTLRNGSLQSCEQCGGTGRLPLALGGNTDALKVLFEGFVQQVQEATSALTRSEKLMADIDESLAALSAAVDGVGLRIQEQHAELTTQIETLQAALADSQNPEALEALQKLQTVASTIDEQVAELNTLAAIQAELPGEEGGQSPEEPPAEEEPPVEEPPAEEPPAPTQ